MVSAGATIALILHKLIIYRANFHLYYIVRICRIHAHLIITLTVYLQCQSVSLPSNIQNTSVWIHLVFLNCVRSYNWKRQFLQPSLSFCAYISVLLDEFLITVMPFISLSFFLLFFLVLSLSLSNQVTCFAPMTVFTC